MKIFNKLFFVLLSFHFSVVGQTKETIIKSNEYYYGEAVSLQENEARDKSLQYLIEQIAVTVSSSLEHLVIENAGSVKDVTKNVLNSYSNATLNNMKVIKRKTDDGIEVFSYIGKSEVEKIFTERKNLIFDIYVNGKNFEKDGNITDALKYYYYSVILMNSIPDKSIQIGGTNLLIEIPLRINSILSNVKFKLIEDKATTDGERELQVNINYLNKPIQSLEFSFWDGSSQVNVRAIDGTGIFRLTGASTSFEKLNLEVKYNYYESRDELKEVSDLWTYVVKPKFKNNIMLQLKKVEESTTQKKDLQPDVIKKFGKYTLQISNPEHAPVIDVIADEAQRCIETLDKKSPEKIKAIYAQDKFLSEKLANVMKFNSLVLIDDDMKAKVNKTATGWELRKIRTLSSHFTLNLQSTEYLILDFDESGKFNDVNFGTVEQLYEQFVEAGNYVNDWGNRQIIVKFVERYRTAYMTRNMEMLDSLFADEAVIIIGRELKKTKKHDEIQYSKMNESQPDYQYLQYTKKEYLENQKKVFKYQKDISLAFSSFKIRSKNDMPGTYGISMRQNYTSSTYADEGHLFLLVDFEQKQPQIYVRSWQPKEWNDDAIIQLSNFRVNHPDSINGIKQ